MVVQVAWGNVQDVAVLTAAQRHAVLYDSQPLRLEAMERVLERAGVATVAQTSDADVVLDLVRLHEPDVLIVDIDGVGDDATVELLRQARAAAPTVRSIALARSDDPERIAAAFAAGATAVCLKTADPADLMLAVRQSFEHSIYLAVPGQPRPPGNASRHTDGNVELTKREREILGLVAQGRSNGQLAKLLWVTEQTVKFHLSNVYRKLDVHNRTEASHWAYLHGLLPEADDAAD